MALRFVEELLILVEEEQVPNRTLRYALAGAALMDLALEGRIDTDPDALYLTDATPMDDALLDPVLAEIAEGPESQSCEFWVRRIAERGDCLHGQALARLEAQGIMESDDGGFFRAGAPGAPLPPLSPEPFVGVGWRRGGAGNPVAPHGHPLQR